MNKVLCRLHFGLLCEDIGRLKNIGSLCVGQWYCFLECYFLIELIFLVPRFPFSLIWLKTLFCFQFFTIALLQCRHCAAVHTTPFLFPFFDSHPTLWRDSIPRSISSYHCSSRLCPCAARPRRAVFRLVRVLQRQHSRCHFMTSKLSTSCFTLITGVCGLARHAKYIRDKFTKYFFTLKFF
jgi:hypothetical protein